MGTHGRGLRQTTSVSWRLPRPCSPANGLFVGVFGGRFRRLGSCYGGLPLRRGVIVGDRGQVDVSDTRRVRPSGEQLFLDVDDDKLYVLPPVNRLRLESQMHGLPGVELLYTTL